MRLIIKHEKLKRKRGVSFNLIEYKTWEIAMCTLRKKFDYILFAQKKIKTNVRKDIIVIFLLLISITKIFNNYYLKCTTNTCFCVFTYSFVYFFIE